MSRAVHILLVEDDSIDVRAMQRALQSLEGRLRLSVASDGVQAMEFLKAAAAPGSTLPTVILLDLNLPRMSGLELLGKLREDPLFSGLPVFVLTTSSNARERREAYRLGVSAYILKERLAGDYSRLLKFLDDYVELAFLDDAERFTP